MTTATFGSFGLAEAANGARPYRHEAVLGEVPVPWGRLQYLQRLAPAGGIDASVADMARYALFQLGDGTMSGRRVVSAQMMAELHRSEVTVSSDWTPTARIENLHYALGWFTADVHGAHLVFHNGNGANPGFRAAIALVPSSRAGAVILTNAESTAFADAVKRSLLEQLLQLSARSSLSRRSAPQIKLKSALGQEQAYVFARGTSARRGRDSVRITAASTTTTAARSRRT
jgi:CubicO group peptidase (beta-lactamase class C family)